LNKKDYIEFSKGTQQPQAPGCCLPRYGKECRLVRPWLSLVGLHLPALPTLPTLVLPVTSQGAIAQPIKRQAA
jgi:hypothetical protein